MSTNPLLRYTAPLLSILAQVPCQEVDLQDPGIRVVTPLPGQRVELDLSQQVLRLDIPEETGWAEWGEEARRAEERIVPRLTDLGRRGPFVPAAVLAHKAKIFDDGLIAAVELLAQRGAGQFVGRDAVLGAVVERLIADRSAGEAAQVVLAATQLGGRDLELPSDLEAAVRGRIRAFEADALQSKPLGFYTWSDELRRVFRQDRMLQTELDDAQEVLRALRSSPRARDGYAVWMHLVRRLTNPFIRPDLVGGLYDDAGPSSSPSSFLPPSRSHETELVKKLYGDRPIPDGFDLAEELVRRVEGGDLDLRPTLASGWYDHQTWALETLARPDDTAEAERLEFTDRYRAELRQLLKGLLALTRETHVKQLEIATVGAAMPELRLTVLPSLAVEPLATYYLRRADSYAFVRRVLVEAFGEEGLRGARRQTADGPVESPLLAEIDAIERIFLGAAVTAARDLGLGLDALGPRRSTTAVGPAVEAFAGWAPAHRNDPDLQSDIRMMVPVFYDVIRKRTKAWVVLGWTRKPLQVSFAQQPAVRAAPRRAKVEFEDNHYDLAYPVTAEVYVSRLLDRDEFRRLCDEHRTKAAILAHLE